MEQRELGWSPMPAWRGPGGSETSSWFSIRLSIASSGPLR